MKDKDTRKRFLFLVYAVIFVILGAIALTATRLSRVPRAQKASSQEIGQRDDLEKQNRAILYTQIHGQKMREILTAFAQDTEPVESATPWRDGVRDQERPQIFGEVCRGLDRFDNMERAFRLISDKDDPITWDELGIEAGDAGKMYWNTGIKIAKLLIKMLEIPRGKRELVPSCSEGKGQWNFANEKVVGNRIIEILDAVHAGASDVGITSAELRQLLITELTSHINELREAESAGTATSKDVNDCLYYLLTSIATAWNVSFEKLGVTPQQYAALQKQTGSRSYCHDEINFSLVKQGGVPH